MSLLRGPAIDLRKVTRVQFGVLSPEDIEKYSVARIESETTYNQHGQPIEGGLMDLRMGSMDKDVPCATDGLGFKESPGYFGHIDLAEEVYHIGYLRIVLQVLRCVCRSCGRIMLDSSDPRFEKCRAIQNKVDRLRAFSSFCKDIKVCERKKPKGDDADFSALLASGAEGCGEPHSQYKQVKLKVIEVKRNAEGNGPQIPLPAWQAKQILASIPNETLIILGLDPVHARPSSMIVSKLPVPPPHVRPTVVAGAKKAEDDLTYKLADIIKANKALREAREQNLESKGTLLDTLQFHIASFFNNNSALLEGTTSTQRSSGKRLKTITERLSGKEGRIRGNLMGKRVDFSARSVITADPNLSIDQVGVPRSIATNLTFPEVVTTFNRDELLKLLKNGNNYPGVKAVIDTNGERTDMRYVRNPDLLPLYYGCTVERHLKDDDCVLFNRQPTLHKMSMMGHRVKVLPYSTFRLNLTVTTPYNADFDGDEMNLHVPQSLTAKAELVELMMVPRNIITAQSNRPVMALVQDALLGSSRLTRRDVFLRRDMFFNCLFHVDDWDGRIPQPAIIKPVHMWTGKQLFSRVLPALTLEKAMPTHDEKAEEKTKFNTLADTKVLILNGELMHGICCKNTLGAKSGSLVHVAFNQLGFAEAKRFLDRVQKVVNHWLVHWGFSVGIQDAIVDSGTQDKIVEIMKEAEEDVSKIEQKFFGKGDADGKKAESEPGLTMMQTFEKNVNKRLNDAGEKAGKAVQEKLRDTNSIKAMVIAGSKGSTINILQIMACVAQNNVEGKRIPFGFRDRTLPHFPRFDYGPRARGFVVHSYIQGLDPAEFFMHAMGGREGLIDTAVKTADTGYMQRRLIKAMEDVQVKYDGTVRSGSGRVLQFLYGEDGMDGAKLEFVSVDALKWDSEDAVRKNILFDGVADGTLLPTFGEGLLLPSVAESLRRKASQTAQKLQQEYMTVLSSWREVKDMIARHKLKEDRVVLPVNLPRLLGRSRPVLPVAALASSTGSSSKGSVADAFLSDLSPLEVIEGVEDLLQRCVVVSGAKTDPLAAEAQQNATMLFAFMVRSLLSSKRVIGEYRLDRKGFSEIIQEAEQRFLEARATPGEMVGALAAQSIGEPATQMTLNTFHYAGVSSKNVTLGVPRLKELINVPKHIKTPSNTVFLKRKYATLASSGTATASKWYKAAQTVHDWFVASAGSYEVFARHVAEKKCVGNVKIVAAQRADYEKVQKELAEEKSAGKRQKLSLSYCAGLVQFTIAKDVQSKLEFTPLRKVISSVAIHYDPTPLDTSIEDDQEWYAEAISTIEQYNPEIHQRLAAEFAYPWMIRIVLDRALVLDKQLSLVDIVREIEDNFNLSGLQDVTCIYGNVIEGDPVIHMRLLSDSAMQMAKDAAEAQSDVADEQNIGKDPKADIALLQDMIQEMTQSIVLHGVVGIEKVYMRNDQKLGEWVLETDGINLREVLAQQHVDPCRTTSNDVTEVLNTLGIEAARAALLRELRYVIENDGSYINYRHLAMLCDVMTSRGGLQSMTRHGINRSDAGPLMRCSFEETVEILLDASAFGASDYIHGVSANIMLGQLAPIGTGSFDLYLDQDKIMNAIDVLANITAADETVRAQNLAKDLRYSVGAAHTPRMGMGGVTPRMMSGAQTPRTASFATPRPDSYAGPTPKVDWAPTPGMLHSGEYFDSPESSVNALAGVVFSPRGLGHGGQMDGYDDAHMAPVSHSPFPHGMSSGSGPYSSYPATNSYGASAASPAYGFSMSGPSPASPAYAGYGVGGAGPTPVSPMLGRVGDYSPTSPQMRYSPTSPQMGGYSPTSPQMGYSPTSPQIGMGGGYQPASPSFSPTSPSYGGGASAGASYSPTSPSFSPTSPMAPKSPYTYSPTSPM